MDIKKLRQKIDNIDDKIVDLLNERFEVAVDVKNFKIKNNLNVHNFTREKEILNRLETKIKYPLTKEYIEDIYNEIFSCSRSLQEITKVSFLGPMATYSHISAMKFFGKSYEYIPVQTIGDVFSEVEKGKTKFGVVPIENSTEGMVNYTLDVFMDSDVKIYNEISLNIHHCLLSTSLKKSDIKKIFVHPQTQAQCRAWLEKNFSNATIEQVESNACAAKKAKEEKNTGAIASEFASEMYGLNILEERIEDKANNMTRFLIISNEMAEKTENSKTSILFSIKDKIGALYDMLLPFRNHNINLTRIESRPTKKKAWEYVFFVDLIGHQDDEIIKQALLELEKKCLFLKVLGSYPSGK